jgi:hypothetical protein
MSKLVNVWGVRHDEDAETLTFKVVCDQEVGDLLLAIAHKDTMTKREMGLELANLLERSIHLNLPRSHRFWHKNRER